LAFLVKPSREGSILGEKREAIISSKPKGEAVLVEEKVPNKWRPRA
jgi:hypothetical protein